MKTLLLLSLVACSGQSLEKTHGLLNGRTWMSFNEERRIFFVAGFSECDSAWKHNADLSMFPKGMTWGEVAMGVTRFFEEPENLGITVADAIFVLGMKTRSSSQADIDAVIAAARRFAQTPDQK